MSALAKLVEKRVIIPSDHRLIIDVPKEIPAGAAVITMTIEPGEEPVNRVGELYGTSKGEFWMADDFDAPMKDFKRRSIQPIRRSDDMVKKGPL